LHAESRSLLPLGNKDYFQYSLMKLKQDIAERVEQGLTPSRRSFDVWNDLDSLFNIIDQGDPDLNVPRYNGGLFRGDHPKNQFLNDNKISDKYLVPALELLTREPDPKTGRKRFIDYKSLNVEQLGSIYEGLLEFHLRIAGEPLAVVKKRGREVFEPEKDVKNPSEIITKGALYLENDKGERKATGSYYTPHYIVEYIVEHTLGPVFDKRAETFENLMGKLEPKYGEYGKLDQKITEGDHSERTHNKRKALHLEIESLENKAKEALLSIKICDPAMGSGHFLKEATDKLAEKIITLLAQYPQNPVTKLLNRVREEILASLDEQDISIDADEHLKDTNLIKRMVMKRSIYGVDLNPMAVELAKLSLWLDSFTVGAPLSFLDHHLKTGNSLIGTTVKEVKFTLELDEERQIEAFGGPFTALLTATQFMRDVAQRTDATISEVQESVAKYHDYEEAIKPYKRLLDLWISRHFDNDKAIVLLRQYPDKIIKEVKGEASDLHENYLPVLEQAEAQAESKRFFHWELEFPEVFIDLKHSKWLENPGFDVVVGNPPYVQIQTLKKIDEKAVSFFNNTFDAAGGNYDLYILFTEKGLRLIKSEGRSGFILPNKLFRVDYGEGLRELFSQGGHVAGVVDFGSEQVFPNAATTYTALLFLEGTQLGDKFEYRKIKSDRDPSTLVNPKDAWTTEIYLKSTLDSSSWNFHPPQAQNLIDTVDSISNPLGDYADSIARGVSTGDDNVFVLQVVEKEQNVAICSSDAGNETFTIETELLRTPIHSTDFQKYQYREQSEKVLLWPYDKTSGHQLRSFDKIEEEFPEAAAYLQRYKSRLEDRAQYSSWHGYSAPRSLAVHDSAEMIIPLLAEKPSFTAYPKPQQNYMLMASGGFSISLKADTDIDPYYVLSLINTDLLFYYLRTLSNIFRGGYVTCTKQYFRQLPIREINFTTPKAERKQHVQTLVNAYQENEHTILNNAQGHLLAEPERSDVIHDFLAFLAEQMLDYNKEKQPLQSALDPFKFLNKGVAFKKFSGVFSEAIKYGQQGIGDIDIGTVHHDIEGLRLTEDGDQWLLSLHLKHRDPETDWADWIKEDGHIVRSTHLVYRFELPDEQAHYWQQAFEVLEEFENSRTIPGGKTRTTHEKLMKTKAPVFDESANIQPLIELREELAEVNQKIDKTDWLIDQVVYQLYGLSEEEIAVVEGSV
jgi:type I restriction-modification system DNA methylase subunit